MNKRMLLPALTLVLCSVPAAARAQLPTSQPSLLTIYREELKYGHTADHVTTEAGWPAAYLKAKSPNYYIALSTMTGTNEVWFLAPFANYKAMGDQIKFDASDPILSAELARLQKADAEHISNGRTMELMGRPDLSAGGFPVVGKARFYEISTFRIRMGHEREFEAIAKSIKAAYEKAAPEASYRVYAVTAGIPGPTYLIMSSTPALADLDKGMAMDAAAMGSLSADDQKALQKFAAEGMINAETQRFSVSGPMSYVDDATANTDLAFWRPGIKASK